ncbi:MAG: ABC transporter permease [Fimbriimonadaceae bacterium]|nr:ABC transporter permease [Fimbriimonadaceae bacterium]
MKKDLAELWRFRELLFAMVEREIRIRYKNSALGFFWSLLNPLITVLVMTAVFKYVMNNNTPNFSAYILAAYLPYLFFQLTLLDSAQSVLASLPVVRKVYFPREILPLASILSNFIHFLLAILVFFVYLLVVYLLDPRVSPFTWQVLILPALLLINFALVTGLSLIISALNTFYEDVKYIVSVLLYLLFFLSPIMYFSETVLYSGGLGGRNQLIYTLYHLNPIAMLCTAYRKVLVPPQEVQVGSAFYPALPLDWGLLGITAVVSITLLVVGYAVFNRMKWRFVERP